MIKIMRKPNNIILILILFIIFSAFIIAVGFWWYGNQKNTTLKHWKDTLESVADLKRGEVVRWRQERIGDALSLSRSPFVLEKVETLFKNNNNSKAAIGLMISRLTLILEPGGYSNIYLLNNKGKIVLSLNESHKGTLNKTTVALFYKSLASGKVMVSDFYPDRAHKTVHIDLISPLIIQRDQKKELLGALVFIINPEQFLYPLIQNWPGPSPSAETLLVEQEGDRVLFLNTLRHRQAPPLTLTLPLDAPQLPAAWALKGHEGMFEGRDYRGVPVLAVTRNIPGSSWHMVAKVDNAEVFAGLYREGRLIAAGVFTLVLLVGTSMGWVLAAQREGHYKELFRLKNERQALLTHFEYLVKYANDIILLMDEGGNLQEANERAVQTYGYDRATLLRLNIRDIVSEGETPAILRWSHQELAEAGNVYEGFHRRQDGNIFPVEVSVNLIQVEGQNYCQEIIRDISERKRAEAEIKLNEARLASLVKIAQYEFESIQDLLDFTLNEAVALTGSKLGYIYSYDKATRQFTLNAWSQDVMQACTIIEPQTIYHLAKTGLWGEAVRQARPIMVNDFQAPHALKKGYPEGHAELYKYLTIPVFSGERIVAVVGVANKASDYDDGDVRQLTLMMDGVWKIVARRQAEEELQLLNLELEQRVRARTAQLEAANQELEAFSYSVSHDLRAPLRGIDGWSLAFLEDYGDGLDDQGRNYLEWVRAETQRMGQLIDAMLSLSRVGRAELRREPVDLTALAQNIADRLRQTGPARQAEFILQPGLTVTADPQLLKIALFNLLDNAWKFTGRQPAAVIEFGRMAPDGQPVFFLRDNGTGFDMTYAANLFGAFQRLHQASEFPGTGIGLATVKRIINRHGGRIWAEAAVDQGATFYFTL